MKGSVFSSYVDPKKDKNLQEEPRKSDNNDPGNYLVNHTSAFYVIDPKDNIII